MPDKSPSLRWPLSPRAAACGPANVSLFKDKRCLGTAVVTAGSAPAFFGVEEAGAVTLKWRLPGGEEKSRNMVAEKVVRVLLDGP
ncbi:MAG: hypothetical protein ABSG86_27275 [Thermoguttaceae bacterium]